MRRALIVAAAALSLAGAAGYVFWVVPTRQAVAIGSGMLSKQMCSCLFVAERSQSECRADQFESMDPIQVEILGDPSGVRAFVPWLGERTATWRSGFGCTLQ
jgi:hypothetical protein